MKKFHCQCREGEADSPHPRQIVKVSNSLLGFVQLGVSLVDGFLRDRFAHLVGLEGKSFQRCKRDLDPTPALTVGLEFDGVYILNWTLAKSDQSGRKKQ